MIRAENRRFPFGWISSSKKTPGRAVELADDHALRAVDDERAAVGDERELAEVDLLLDHVLHLLFAVARVVPDDQAQRRLQRHRVREIALLALLDGVLRRPDLVRDELEREIPARVRDRENVLEDRLQAFPVTLLRRHDQLQEVPERIELDSKEIRDLHHRVQLREVVSIRAGAHRFRDLDHVAHSFNGVRHRCSEAYDPGPPRFRRPRGERTGRTFRELLELDGTAGATGLVSPDLVTCKGNSIS